MDFVDDLIFPYAGSWKNLDEAPKTLKFHWESLENFENYFNFLLKVMNDSNNYGWYSIEIRLNDEKISYVMKAVEWNQIYPFWKWNAKLELEVSYSCYSTVLGPESVRFVNYLHVVDNSPKLT